MEYGGRFRLLKFFRDVLISTPDSDLKQLSDALEKQIKQVKLEIYKISWYMRGGVDSATLLYDTDIEDIEIMSSVIKENIESTKKTGLPLL